MFRFFSTLIIGLFLVLYSCSQENKKQLPNEKVIVKPVIIKTDTIIIDSKYTFEEAISGSNAPQEILNQLELIDVQYYSIDHKLHQGQILTNKKISSDLTKVFEFILHQHFPVAKVIPIVNYNWNDNLSMQDNNTYSFCYRDVNYSKHAKGMAIDINPFYNPVRWKNDSIKHTNKPIGAVYNPEIPGTFTPLCPVVQEFRRFHFRWGHNFHKKFDDHHFER